MIRLYLDEDVHKKVATALRLKGYDVVSTHEVQKQSLPDYRQLDYAISGQRAIFTFNAGDFDRLHKEYVQSGKQHFGIILSKQIPIGETIKRLTKFLFTHSSEEIKNNIFWI
ncbi:MAG: DUF5615 family PIN-like protein [Thermodesulfovibrionales bacterium]|nr:DUF5615 family PIN-like protein [Thermodesulfovibrionales bacterium]